MTHEEFDKFQKELIVEVVKIRDTKGKEYSNGEDRFGNFRRLAPQLGITDLQVAWVYLAKHLDGIASYCRTEQALSEPIRGRIVDAITYLTLLAGMIAERTPKSGMMTCHRCGTDFKTTFLLDAHQEICG